MVYEDIINIKFARIIWNVGPILISSISFDYGLLYFWIIPTKKSNFYKLSETVSSFYFLLLISNVSEIFYLYFTSSCLRRIISMKFSFYFFSYGGSGFREIDIKLSFYSYEELYLFIKIELSDN